MDKQETKLLEEVALRNALAMFRQMNAVSKKKSLIPEVGLFWIDDSGEMFAEGISLREAEDYGDFKIFEGSHYDLWGKAVLAKPNWRNSEYEEIPRGRVVYRKDPKKPEFIVYLPKRIRKYGNKVIDRFSLPSGYVRFDMSDEHYRM